MAQFSKLSTLSVALAAGTLSTAPAAAAELSDQASIAASTLPQVEIFSADEMAAEHHRRWRGYRYRGYRHRRHRIPSKSIIG